MIHWYRRETIMENKKLGDPVWILDYSSNAHGSMVEHAFLMRENGKVLTMLGSSPSLHDEHSVFASPMEAATEMERNIRLEAVSKANRKETRLQIREDLDARLAEMASGEEASES